MIRHFVHVIDSLIPFLCWHTMMRCAVTLLQWRGKSLRDRAHWISKKNRRHLAAVNPVYSGATSQQWQANWLSIPTGPVAEFENIWRGNRAQFRASLGCAIVSYSYRNAEIEFHMRSISTNEAPWTVADGAHCTFVLYLVDPVQSKW